MIKINNILVNSSFRNLLVLTASQHQFQILTHLTVWVETKENTPVLPKVVALAPCWVTGELPVDFRNKLLTVFLCLCVCYQALSIRGHSS